MNWDKNRKIEIYRIIQFNCQIQKFSKFPTCIYTSIQYNTNTFRFIRNIRTRIERQEERERERGCNARCFERLRLNDAYTDRVRSYPVARKRSDPVFQSDERKPRWASRGAFRTSPLRSVGLSHSGPTWPSLTPWTA